jgi:hypothetical protein
LGLPLTLPLALAPTLALTPTRTLTLTRWGSNIVHVDDGSTRASCLNPHSAEDLTLQVPTPTPTPAPAPTLSLSLPLPLPLPLPLLLLLQERATREFALAVTGAFAPALA